MTECLVLNIISHQHEKNYILYYFCSLIKITKYQQKRGALGDIKETKTSISNYTAGQNREIKKLTLATGHVVQGMSFRVSDLGLGPSSTIY